MFYFETPNYSVAFNAKVASSALARAIISQFQPETDFLIRTAAFPPGVTDSDRQWHTAARGNREPSKPVVLLVREPVARFITACQQVRIRQADLDAAIASLVNDAPFRRTRPPDVTREQWGERQARRREIASARASKRANMEAAGRRVQPAVDRSRLRCDVHFLRQSGYMRGPTTCFQFPRDIAAAVAFIGIQSPLPHANAAKRPKPELSPAQRDAVLAYYASDVVLFDSITQPATVVNTQ